RHRLPIFEAIPPLLPRGGEEAGKDPLIKGPIRAILILHLEKEGPSLPNRVRHARLFHEHTPPLVVGVPRHFKVIAQLSQLIPEPLRTELNAGARWVPPPRNALGWLHEP